MYSTWIRPPRDEEELGKVEEVYRRMGFPGMVGSIDVVHLLWDNCPVSERSLYKGKEGSPSVAFEVTCTRTREIINTTAGQYGTFNDLTTVRFDGLVDEFRNPDNPFYDFWTSMAFKVKTATGGDVELKGAYLASDGGYHKWRCFLSTTEFCSDPTEKLLLEALESIRKEVECVFGILKIRFRILKYPMRFWNKETVDNVFQTCCILHNMLLHHDGHTHRFECDGGDSSDDDVKEPEDDDEEEQQHRQLGLIGKRAAARVAGKELRYPVGTYQLSDKLCPSFAGLTLKAEEEKEHHILRKHMIAHYHYVFHHGMVEWLS
jgi:hypothetical protein